MIEVGNKTIDYTPEDIELLETISNYISPILKLRLDSIRNEQKFKESMSNKSKSKQMLDEVDCQILNVLHRDGRQSPVRMEIQSKNKKMSHTGIINRISKLEEKGILKIQGNIDINKLKVRTALIRIEFNNFDFINNYVEYYKDCPRIFVLLKLTGQYHLSIGVMGRSMEDLNQFINFCLLAEREKIKSSDITFASELTKPQYLPLNFFIVDIENTKCGRNCRKCDAFNKDMCIGCDFLD